MTDYRIDEPYRRNDAIYEEMEKVEHVTLKKVLKYQLRRYQTFFGSAEG